jgi:outer membrane lipoprotein-sorting protein
MKTLKLLIISTIITTGIYAQDAKEIVRKADDLMKGNSNYSEISMLIHRPKWERNLKMKSWAKGDDYALVYITEPAKEEGQVFLKREREMWNWLPSINRTIKIPPSMMMQSWMGSDLTNDDLVNQSSIVDDYDHKILAKESIDGYECFKIELIPHEDAPVVWGKIYSWISVNEYYTLRNEYYDEDEELVNTEILSNIKDVGDRKIPTRFKVIPEDEDDYYTIMEFESIRFNIKIEDGFFSIQNMKKVR